MATSSLDLSYLHLLPIQCDLDEATTSISPPLPVPFNSQVSLLYVDENAGLSVNIGMDDDLGGEEEECDSMPSSPSRSRLVLVDADNRVEKSISNVVAVTPVVQRRGGRSSITPMFQKAPLFPARPMPVMPTPSRIPPSSASVVPQSSPSKASGVKKRHFWATSSAAPGIRMPGDMHLSYVPNEKHNPSNNEDSAIQLPSLLSSSAISTSSSTSAPQRLDLDVDNVPKCTAYLSSPYPRLTKYANHAAKFYEKKLEERRETFLPPLHSAESSSSSSSLYSSSHLSSLYSSSLYSSHPSSSKTSHKSTSFSSSSKTPKRTDGTCASSGSGAVQSRTVARTPSAAPSVSLRRKASAATVGRVPTVPRSPKLATASRLRKCQCCEGGVHGGGGGGGGRRGGGGSEMKKKTKDAAVGCIATESSHKRAAGRRNGAETTIGKRQATMRRRPSPSKPSAVPASSSSSTHVSHKQQNDYVSHHHHPQQQPVQRKLNLTTSLPQFTQPLALIAPTPEPSKDEVRRRLLQPIPSSTPSSSSVQKKTAKTQSVSTTSTTTTATTTVPATASSRSSQVNAPTPIKMKSLEEALGPNYRLIHAFNESHPIPLEPLQETLGHIDTDSKMTTFNPM